MYTNTIQVYFESILMPLQIQCEGLQIYLVTIRMHLEYTRISLYIIV